MNYEKILNDSFFIIFFSIGYYLHDHVKHRNQDYYPGMDEYSFGFDNEGNIYWNNIKKK